MFKYGGPIKEGVMHGMKNGGPTGTGLVGDQRYPKTGGREHHGFFLPALYGAGAAALRFLPNIYRGFRAGQTLNPALKGWSKLKNLLPSGRFRRVPGQDPSAAYIKGDPSAFAGSSASRMGMWKALGDPKRLGAAIRENPGTALTLGGLGGTGVSKLFRGSEPKKVELLPQQGGPPGGGDPGMYYEAPPKTKSAEELAAEAKAARKAKLNKYLDTMGYDKAKKGAIGDALIDASAIVQQGTEEGGSLKHANWSKMINQAIQATSKRLKKPEQIREAVGLMMTKADIQKDLEDPQVKELRRLQIEGAEKTLAGATLQEVIADSYIKTGSYPSGSNLAGLARVKGLDIEKVIKTADVDTFIKNNEGADAVDFMEAEVLKAQKEGKKINSGAYVVKDRIIYVDEKGNIKPYL